MKRGAIKDALFFECRQSLLPMPAPGLFKCRLKSPVCKRSFVCTNKDRRRARSCFMGKKE